MSPELEEECNLDPASISWVYEAVKWNNYELAHQILRHQCTGDLTFRKALNISLNRSSLGQFVTLPRDTPFEDLICLLALLRFEKQRGTQHRHSDMLCNNLIAIVEAAVRVPVTSIRTSFNKLLVILRLVDCRITTIDRTVRDLDNLQVLSLAGNCISTIQGSHLPRKLKLLELHGNRLNSVQQLCNGLPQLMHLGLSRNNICSDSDLQLLANEGKSELRSLDLSSNEIEDLLKVLETLSRIPHLKSVQLEDNPCAMCYLYQKAVVLLLPNLNYLDGVFFEEKDVDISDEDLDKGTRDGAILISCFRIMGLEQPKKNETFEKKKVAQTFLMEFDVPLFDPVRRMKTKDASTSTEEFETNRTETLKSDLPVKSSPQNGKEKPRALIGVEEPEPTNLMRFKTPPSGWKEVIEFPAPSIRINTSKIASLRQLRDTFRSSITARVIYMKTISLDESKKGDKKKDLVKTPPVEKVISRLVLCNFEIPLESICWADRSLDYTWTETSSEVPKDATLSPGTLQELQYGGVKGNPKAKPGASILIPVPKNFTCHVGIGLQRTIPDPVRDRIPSQPEGKSKLK